MALSDQELLEAIAAAGARFLASAKKRQADVGGITDDARWHAPIPLRFELQLASLFLGALDAYDISTGILRARASQQAFNAIRFQLETLALVRWMVEPTDPSVRQVRAYRVLHGQITRWSKLLKEDTAGAAEVPDVVDAIGAWLPRLLELAAQDGLPHLKSSPDRKYLITNYASDVGYPTFSMYSELGAHPGAIGNIMFGMRDEERIIDYTLDESFVARAFWSGVALIHLWPTCEAVSGCLGWDEWLTNEARPIYMEALTLIDDAADRRKGVLG